jgi:hypothetical protein
LYSILQHPVLLEEGNVGGCDGVDSSKNVKEDMCITHQFGKLVGKTPVERMSSIVG